MEKQSASAGTRSDKMLRKTDGNFQFLPSFFYFRAIRYENFAQHATRVSTKNEWKITRFESLKITHLLTVFVSLTFASQ